MVNLALYYTEVFKETWYFGKETEHSRVKGTLYFPKGVMIERVITWKEGE